MIHIRDMKPGILYRIVQWGSYSYMIGKLRKIKTQPLEQIPYVYDEFDNICHKLDDKIYNNVYVEQYDEITKSNNDQMNNKLNKDVSFTFDGVQYEANFEALMGSGLIDRSDRVKPEDIEAGNVFANSIDVFFIARDGRDGNHFYLIDQNHCFITSNIAIGLKQPLMDFLNDKKCKLVKRLDWAELLHTK